MTASCRCQRAGRNPGPALPEVLCARIPMRRVRYQARKPLLSAELLSCD